MSNYHKNYYEDQERQYYENESFGNGNDVYDEAIKQELQKQAEQSDTQSDNEEQAEIDQGMTDLVIEEKIDSEDEEEKVDNKEEIRMRKNMLIKSLTDELYKIKTVDGIVNKYTELEILLSTTEQKKLKDELFIKINKNTKDKIINSLTWLEHTKLNNGNPRITKLGKNLVKMDYIRYLFTIPKKNKEIRDNILNKSRDDPLYLSPIKYYKESLKQVDKYVQTHKIKSLTRAIGDGYEAHRKRLWEYFGFKVFGNEKGSQERFLGGYAIDQYIFWKKELIVLEEDKAHLLDSPQLEHVMMGMAKTIYNYQTKSLDFSDDFTVKKIPPKILINSLCKSWADVNTFKNKVNECYNVLDEKYKFNIDHTYLSEETKITNWYKPTGGGINCFYENAEEEKIKEDIRYIIELIPKDARIEIHKKNKYDWGQRGGPTSFVNAQNYFYDELNKN